MLFIFYSFSIDKSMFDKLPSLENNYIKLTSKNDSLRSALSTSRHSLKN